MPDSIMLRAMQAGHEAALRFAVEQAELAAREAEAERRVLAFILREHGPFVAPTDEDLEGLDDGDRILAAPLKEHGPDGEVYLQYLAAADALELMQETFEHGEEPEPE